MMENARRPTVFELLQELGTNEELREAFSDEDYRYRVLDEYDLTDEQRVYVMEAADLEADYESRIQATGRLIDAEYRKISAIVPIC